MSNKKTADTTAATEVEPTVVATDPDRQIDPELVDQLLEQAGDDQDLPSPLPARLELVG